MRFVYYLHLLGATVWIGGLIVVGATVSAVRRVSDDRAVISAIVRRFAALSWTAMALLVATGIIQAWSRAWTGVLLVKVALVLASILLALWHSLAAGTQSAPTRAAIQASLLILALAILGLAIAL